LSLDDSDGEEGEEGSSSSEFELTLDEPSSPTEEGTSSEFELSLDLEESSSEEMEGTATQHSDSEFELTIDEGGALEMDDSAALEEEDKDIFETDFEVPPWTKSPARKRWRWTRKAAIAATSISTWTTRKPTPKPRAAAKWVPLDEDVDELVPVKKKKGGRTMVVDDEEPPGEFEDLVEETEPALEEEPELGGRRGRGGDARAAVVGRVCPDLRDGLLLHPVLRVPDVV